MLSIIDIFLCLELSSHLPYLLEHPSAGSSFLASGLANLFSSSLSVPALFFLLPLFLAQLNFLFCVHFTRSILLHTHISNASSSFCSFRRSAQVSAPYNLHSTQNTSLLSSVVLFQGPAENASFAVKGFFCHCYPLVYFLTAVHVATNITPHVFEAVHLFNGFTFNSYIYLWLSSDNHGHGQG